MAKVDDKKPPVGPPAPASKLDTMKLPAGAILVVVEHLADALKMVPTAVVLTPEQYQEYLGLEEQVKKLKAQLAGTDKPATPSTVRLKGKVEGNFVYLQAQIDLVTKEPNTVVALALGQAQPSNPKLDDKTPLLRSEPNGFTVQIEKPGDHLLTMDLMLGLVTRSGGLAIELDLPRSAGTTIDLDLPDEVKDKDLRVGGQLISGTLLTFKNHHLGGHPNKNGPAEKLDIAWKGPNPAPGGAPVLTAEGRINVRLAPGQMFTEVELVLKAQAGQTQQWQLLVPPGAELKLEPADEDRVQAVRVDDKTYKHASLRTIVLKEAGGDPLKVSITARGQPPLPNAPVAVGPFFVKGAFRQTGAILISNTIHDLRPQFQPRCPMEARALSEEERRDLTAAFKYWNPVEVKEPRAATGPASLSLLDLDAETVRGQIEVRVTHTLTLQPEKVDGQRAWRVATVLDAKPVRAEVDHLDVDLPLEWDFDQERSPGATDRVRHVEYDADKRRVRFYLARSVNEPLKPFQLTLEARSRNVPKENGPAVLPLPRPSDTLDAGGHQVTVRVDKGLELLTPEHVIPPLEPGTRETHEQTWRARRYPERIEVAWQRYQPEPRVEAVIDLTLGPREATVRHTLRLQFLRGPLTQIELKVPEALAGREPMVEGGTFEGPAKAGVRLVKLPESVGKEHRLVLEYSFPLTETRPGELAVPLVTPQVSQGETKVRVWAEPGCLPVAGEPWVEEAVEEVPGMNRLPALVVRCQQPNQQLSLRLCEGTGATVTALIERVLVRVVVLDDGGQNYRTSFLVSQLANRSLDVELPAPVATLNPRVTLDGKEVTPGTVDETGQQANAGRTLRLRLPESLHREAVLEVSYQIPAGRAASGLVQTVLSPPVLKGDLGRAPVRWQVSLPPGWVALAPEVGPGTERTWARRGWLLAPRLTTTSADLERWFAAPESVPAAEESFTPSLVCWRGGLEPLTVTHVPQQAWLMICSLGLLLVGLMLYLLARPKEAGRGISTAWLMPMLLLLVLAAAVAGLLWPTLVAAVAFGCEPGAVVLLAFAGVQWLLHERYRRQVVFLPSFSRGRGGSSLTRSSAKRPLGEPSTVDAPRYNGSSQQRVGEPAPPASSAEAPGGA
jgi:hypothetical protein